LECADIYFGSYKSKSGYAELVEKTNAFREIVVVVVADLIGSHTTTNFVSLYNHTKMRTY
jgi:hypothetical protein